MTPCDQSTSVFVDGVCTPCPEETFPGFSPTGDRVCIQSAPPWMNPYPYMRSALRRLQPHTNGIMRAKCRPTWPVIRPLHVATFKLRGYLEDWRYRHKKAHALPKAQCLPTSPQGIIRYVFGGQAWAALRVSYCETGGTFNVYARNRSSGAAGLFQLMPFHWIGKFNPYDPWANSRYAYRLSIGGTNWQAWVCRP